MMRLRIRLNDVTPIGEALIEAQQCLRAVSMMKTVKQPLKTLAVNAANAALERLMLQSISDMELTLRAIASDLDTNAKTRLAMMQCADRALDVLIENGIRGQRTHRTQELSMFLPS